MRILLTGRNGQVGWELERSLAGLGEVSAFDVSSMDLAVPDQIVARVREIKPDVIVNAAAYTAVDAAEQEPELAMAINGTAPGVLAEEAKRLGSLLVHYSTDYVFDGTKDGPYAEDDATGPIGAYGRSKLAGEEAVRAACKRHVILRTAWVYGVHGGNFVKTMLRVGAERPELKVVGDQVGSPSFAVDIARAVLAVVSNIVTRPDDRDLYGTFHCSGAGSTSWHGFACKIFDLAAPHLGKRPVVREITTAEYPTPARRPANSRLSSDKLKAFHGASMRPWEEALAAMLSTYFAEHPGGKPI